MVRKYVLPVLALGGFVFALWMAWQLNRPVIAAKPVADPPAPPYESKISGSGIVEAGTRNIAVAAPVSGVVDKVLVRVAQRVQTGTALFVLDERQARAVLAVKEKAWAEAGARLARLRAAPRGEELPPARARVQEAEAVLADLKLQLKAAEDIGDPRAVSREDVNKRRYAVQAAEARLAQARTSLDLLTAGTWKADLEVARTEVDRAGAEVQAARVEIERLTVRAPVAGHVLQVNIRAGEFAAAGPTAQPLMLVGDLDRLQVRVDIDENDAWRFQPGLAATAFVRGNPRLKTALSFEYVEPYVIPKKSLTGDSTERVDTRVMQVVYSFPRTALPVYPGQLMDVYIEDKSGPDSTKAKPAVEKGRP
jgi:multidrug resistance efflux pump